VAGECRPGNALALGRGLQAGRRAMSSAPIEFVRDDEELSAVLLLSKGGAVRTAVSGGR
jgi:hypothetical protein